MVIITDGVKVIIVNIMGHIKVYLMNKQNVFVLNFGIKINIELLFLNNVTYINHTDRYECQMSRKSF